MTIETFNSGSGIFVVPAGVYTLTRRLWGGGGGGGAGVADTGPGSGTGGGGGGYCEKTESVMPGDMFGWQVGTGGQGGDIATDNAGDGNDTVSAGFLVAEGGGRGRANGIGIAGVGGYGSGGDSHLVGANGSLQPNNSTGGAGGAGANGGLGGAGGAFGVAGEDGDPPGGGGGGAGKGAPGGDGISGRIEFEYEILPFAVVHQTLGNFVFVCTTEKHRAAFYSSSLYSVLMSSAGEKQRVGYTSGSLDSVSIVATAWQGTSKNATHSSVLGRLVVSSLASGSVAGRVASTLDRITTKQTGRAIAQLSDISLFAFSMDPIFGEVAVTLDSVTTEGIAFIQSCSFISILDGITSISYGYKLDSDGSNTGRLETLGIGAINTFTEGKTLVGVLANLRSSFAEIVVTVETETSAPEEPLEERTGYLI